MLEKSCEREYQKWLELAKADVDLQKELQEISGNKEKIEDAFYCNLIFGTGGLRGKIGAGTNRMNVYTVGKASQGLADYVCKHFPVGKRRIAIGFDSRVKSELFAKTAASVFAANEIEACIYKELMPVPCLSFAVRKHQCAAGVMITASHNPAEYNGYKVYGADGCQITLKAGKEIQEEIEKLILFEDIKTEDFNQANACGKIYPITEDTYEAYLEEVKKQTLVGNAEVRKDIAIIYTPLHGAGLKPVLRTLKESGYTNITVVKEQENPDGNFTACPYPNPEIRETMALGMEYAAKMNADILLATDPDCDRIGIGVKDKNGEFVLLSGNETGILLLDYICARRIELGNMPAHPVMLKTIVTTDMAEQIASHYGVRTINVLTGFKYIGEQIAILEERGEENNFIFGFEESCGYLSGTYVRDKDGVNGAFLICEMVSYYKSRGISLMEKLKQLYEWYGYCLNTLHSYEFQGAAGQDQIKDIMGKLRDKRKTFGSKEILGCMDYSNGCENLPKADVLKFILEDACSIVVRPSGTEPKLKVYISVQAKNKQKAEIEEQKLLSFMEEYFLCK